MNALGTPWKYETLTPFNHDNKTRRALYIVFYSHYGTNYNNHDGKYLLWQLLISASVFQSWCEISLRGEWKCCVCDKYLTSTWHTYVEGVQLRQGCVCFVGYAGSVLDRLPVRPLDRSVVRLMRGGCVWCIFCSVSVVGPSLRTMLRCSREWSRHTTVDLNTRPGVM